jgi:hypothetical protein
VQQCSSWCKGAIDNNLGQSAADGVFAVLLLLPAGAEHLQQEADGSQVRELLPLGA